MFPPPISTSRNRYEILGAMLAVRPDTPNARIAKILGGNFGPASCAEVWG